MSNWLKIHIVITLALLLLFSCKSENKELSATLDKAEQTLESFPDSTLVLLQSIEDLPKSDNQAVRYAMLLIEAKEKHNIDFTSDTTLLTDAITRINSNDKAALAKAYFYRCKAYYNSGTNNRNTKKAVPDCIDAVKYAKQTADSAMMAQTLSYIGDLHYNNFTFQEALNHYKNACEIYNSTGNYRDEVVMYGKIGGTYNVVNKFDSALIYQYQALNNLGKIYDSTSTYDQSILSLLYKNIGNTYRMMGNRESQKEFFLKAYQTTPEQGGYDFNVIVNLLTMSYGQEKPDSALYYARQYKVDTSNSYTNRAHYSFHWYKTLNMLGMDSLAIKHLEAFTTLQSKIYEETINKSVLEIQKKYDKEVVENSYNQVLVQRLYLVITVIAITLIGSLLGWLLVYKMKKKENELLEAQQTLTTLRHLVSGQKKREGELENSLQEKEQKLRSFLDEKLDIARKVAQMNIVVTDNGTTFLNQYQKVFKRDLMEEIDWANLYSVINELYDGFYEKIKKQYSTLPEKDLQMCCFIRAGFLPEEIGVLLNYTQNTVRVKKSKLGQKMGFTDYNAFLTFINEL